MFFWRVFLRSRSRPDPPPENTKNAKSGAGGAAYSYSSVNNPRAAMIKTGFAAAYMMAG